MPGTSKRIIPTVPPARDAARAAADEAARRARIEAPPEPGLLLWKLAVAGLIVSAIVAAVALHFVRAF